MDTSMIYIPIVLAVLVLIAVFSYIIKKHKGENKFTPLEGLAFGFVLTGLCTTDDRFIGFSLLGIGILLAVIDIMKKLQEKNNQRDTPTIKLFKG